MPDYTPTTAQVRTFWASEGNLVPAAKSENYVEAEEEFDRWLVDLVGGAYDEGLADARGGY